MTAEARSLLEKKGYQIMPDGSFSRHDSQFVPAAAVTGSLCGKPKKKTPKKAEPSELALKFEAMWKMLGGPELTPEHVFHPTRKWRLDYYHPGTMIAIELEGGIFIKGRHSRPKGMQNDADKYNAAQLIGITVFRLTTGQVTRERLEPIMQAILTRAHHAQ